MIYILVLFMWHADEPGFVPEIIDVEFTSAIECWNVGFSMKTSHPKQIVFFNCEPRKTE